LTIKISLSQEEQEGCQVRKKSPNLDTSKKVQHVEKKKYQVDGLFLPEILKATLVAIKEFANNERDILKKAES